MQTTDYIEYLLEDDSMERWNGYSRSEQLKFKQVKGGKYSSAMYKVKPENQSSDDNGNKPDQKADYKKSFIEPGNNAPNVAKQKFDSAKEKLSHLAKDTLLGRATTKIGKEFFDDAAVVAFGYNVKDKDELEEIKERAEHFKEKIEEFVTKMTDEESILSKAVHSAVGQTVNKIVSRGYSELEAKGVELKSAARAVKKIVTRQKLDHHEKKALHGTLKEIGLAIGTALIIGPLGHEIVGVVSPAIAGHLAGAELGSKAGELASELLKDVGIDIVKASLTTAAVNASISTGVLGKVAAGAKIGASAVGSAVKSLFADDSSAEDQSVVNALLLHIADYVKNNPVNPAAIVAKIADKAGEFNSTKQESIELRYVSKFVESKKNNQKIVFNQNRSFRVLESNAQQYDTIGYKVADDVNGHNELVKIIKKSLGVSDEQAKKIASYVMA